MGTGEEHDFEDIEQTAEDTNMCLAFPHVVADRIRSVTSVSPARSHAPSRSERAKWDARGVVMAATVLLGSVHPRGLVPRQRRQMRLLGRGGGRSSLAC